MELYNEPAAAALFNSNLDQLHGVLDSNTLDLDININDMVEMLQAPPAAFYSDDPRFAPAESINLYSSHQLNCSLPPTIQESEAFKYSFGCRKLSCGRGGGNFSNSSGESEPAVSQGSSSTLQADHSSKRKLEDYCQIFSDSSERMKKDQSLSSNIDFRVQEKKGYNYEPDMEAIAQMKEMIYRAAAMRPVNLLQLDAVDAGEPKKPKRKNVRISSDPQTVAARRRRERVSDRLRILQKLVPGGSQMDTASMLDEAANYLSFLKSQVTALETLASCTNPNSNPPFQHEFVNHHHHHSFPPPLHQNPNQRLPSSHMIDHQHQHS